jgi:hypothetical protein
MMIHGGTRQNRVFHNTREWLLSHYGGDASKIPPGSLTSEDRMFLGLDKSKAAETKPEQC